MITVPVSASMYQSMIANIQQLHTNSDGTVCITPVQVDSHNHNNNYQCYSIMPASTAVNAIGSGVTMTSSPGNCIVTTTIPPTITANVANSRCQIFNPNLSNLSSQQPVNAKIFIASNSNRIGSINGSNSSVISNTNNNSNNLSKSNNNNCSNISNGNTSTTKTVPLNTAVKNSKRRKQTFAKSNLIKQEVDSNTDSVLDIQIVKDEPQTAKAIKLEKQTN